MQIKSRWLIAAIFVVIFPAQLVSADVSIFYCNGMFSSQRDAGLARDALKREIGTTLNGQNIAYGISYNQDEGASSMVEVAKQKGIEVWPEVIDWLSGAVEAPDWFWEAMETLLVTANSLAAWIPDQDLWDNVSKYRAEIDAGNKVLLVGHSQGNFYANEAYLLINSPDDLKVVSVANPSDHVAGSGPYTTLYNDKVINSVRRAFGALPGNMENTRSYEWQNHNFLLSYFGGDRSGPKIIKDIKDQIASLQDIPVAPSNLKATGGDQKADISWDAALNANSYNLYRQNAGLWFLEQGNIMDTFATVLNLENGERYFFAVRSVNRDGDESAPSMSVGVTPSSQDKVWYRDADRDGYGDANVTISSVAQPSGYVADSSDCDDRDGSIHPGAAEICNDGVDQDCYGNDAVCECSVFPAPAQKSPANGESVQSLTPTLSWSLVSCAAHTPTYRVMVSADSSMLERGLSKDCAGCVFNSTTKNTFMVIPASVNLQNNKRYYWQVRAGAEGVGGEWSEIFSFITQELAIANISGTWIQEIAYDQYGGGSVTITSVMALTQNGNQILGKMKTEVNLSGCCGPVQAICDLAGTIQGDLIKLSLVWRGKEICHCTDDDNQWIQIGDGEGSSYQMPLSLSADKKALIPEESLCFEHWDGDEWLKICRNFIKSEDVDDF